MSRSLFYNHISFDHYSSHSNYIRLCLHLFTKRSEQFILQDRRGGDGHQHQSLLLTNLKRYQTGAAVEMRLERQLRTGRLLVHLPDRTRNKMWPGVALGDTVLLHSLPYLR